MKHAGGLWGVIFSSCLMQDLYIASAGIFN